MALVRRWLTAVYTFLVGDVWILFGTLGALVIVALLAQIAPTLAGGLLLVLIALTLAVALQRETTPRA